MMKSPLAQPQFLAPLTGKLQTRNFAVYDIETTTDLERVYLVGFYDGNEYRYWESAPMRPQERGSAMDQFMRWLLGTGGQYAGTWIYAHNGGNFDVLYVIRWAIDNIPDYTLELVPVQSTVLALEIVEQPGQKNKWKMLDSYRLLNASLDSVGKAFGLGSKLEDIDYETLAQNPRRYEYLERDCRLLYGCLERFCTVVRDLGGDIGITAPATAMAVFRRSYQHRKYPLNRHFPECPSANLQAPQITSCRSCMHNFVRRGYYGGRTEVYRETFDARKERGHRLSYGDINSMYPAAMRLPMPIELSSVKDGPLDFPKFAQHWCGYVECRVSVPLQTYLPVLPYRYEGRLVFPVGVFTGVWSSVELTAALKQGAKIEWFGRSIWFKPEVMFSEYVDEIYKFRDKTRTDFDPAMAAVAKLMLNSLYGKMGMVEEREKLWLNPTDDDMAEHTMSVLQELGHGVFSEEILVEATYVLPHVAAWVTSLARLKLHSIMQGFLDAGHRIYYCDTDSIFTDAPIVSNDAIGELKLVDTVKRARFVAPKMYFYETTQKKTEVKAKGFTGGFGAPSLDEKAFLSIVDHGKKVQMQRMKKLREGLRDKRNFPSMKYVEKGIQGVDMKRLHLHDGNTKPLLIMEGQEDK